MAHDRTDPRAALLTALVAHGYQLVEQSSDVSDPLAWKIIARCGDYELRCEERAVSLVDRTS